MSTSTLAAAQAQVLASLVQNDLPASATMQFHHGLPLTSSQTTVPNQYHVTGLDQSTHAQLFQSPPPSTSTARQQATDYSALMLDAWLEEYLQERTRFTSVSLFCEVKLREMIEITNTLHVGGNATEVAGNGQQLNEESTRSIPSKLRTAVCIDLLDILIASVIQPELSADQMTGAITQSAQSRQALGHLLLKLRDELIKSIYVQPIPAHCFLQYTSYFNKPSTHLAPAQPPAKRSLPGSLTSRHRQLEEKSTAHQEEKSNHGGASTHRGRLITTTANRSHPPSASLLTGPPSCIHEFLKCTEWFSIIPHHVQRNRLLAEQARLIMIPSKLFRLRQIQKKVVGGMTRKWRELLLKWKFFEWREIVKQKKLDRQYDRHSKIVNRLTEKQCKLEMKVVFIQWRQLVVYRKYRLMRDAKQKGLNQNAELVEETFRLSEETHLIREESARLDKSNASLSAELKMLRAKLENSQVDLQDTSKHQQQCNELLDALRSPLKSVFAGLQQQLESFAGRDFSTVLPLISTIVNQEYQQELEKLGMPTMVGLEEWQLSISQGSSKQRISICAELVARWLALQLKLCTQVLSGGQGNYSEYLVKLENQQRIIAALARIRQLCSSNPPTSLPPFPVLKKHVAPPKDPKNPALGAPAAGGSMTAALATLPMGRSRARTVTAQPPIPSATASAETKDSEDAASSEDPKIKAARAANTIIKTKKGSIMTGTKIDDLPPAQPGSDSLNKVKRLLEGQAIPTGTLSTPIRVFAQLRDSDRPETIFSISSVMMHADAEVARSLKLPSEKRWSEEERSKVNALKSLMETLRVTADMKASEMDAAVQTAHEGIEATHSAMSRARSAQARLQAVEDEVFAQSVKLLHQQSQRKHRHGERENNIPTDLLDVDISLFSDALDLAQTTKLDVSECNKVFEEYCRDLYKIFTYYCHSQSGATSANILQSLTQNEPRMGNGEFWRFVRECKLKLQQTAMIDLVFLRVADRSGDSDSTSATPSTGGAAGATTTASLIANLSEGMSLSESELLAEKARQSESIHKDIGFKQFGETLLRLSLIKYPNEKSLGRKLKNFLLTNVLPNTSQKALTFHKQLQTAQLASSAAAAASSSGAGATAGPQNVNLNTLEVDQVFRRYNNLLRQIFQIYARITPNFMTMTFNDFLGFAREFELLHKYVTQHDLKQLFSNVIRDGSSEEVTNLTGGGLVSPTAPNVNAAMAQASKTALKRLSSTVGVEEAVTATGSGTTTANEEDPNNPSGNYQVGHFSQLRDGPSHQSMEHTPLGQGSPGLIMQQRNGWCDCRLGFAIQPYTDGIPPPNDQLPPPSLSMWQSGSCCARLFCTPLFKVFRGDIRLEQMDNEEQLQQNLAYTHEKPICVCCAQMITRDASGATIGRTVRQCTCCVPSYAVENGNGQILYTLSPDVCLGCIPKIELTGSGCCQIPWYIRDPVNGEHLPNHANIVHVWTGMKREFCTPNTTVRASYPPQSTTEEKATLLGATLLITLQAKQDAQQREEGGN